MAQHPIDGRWCSIVSSVCVCVCLVFFFFSWGLPLTEVTPVECQLGETFLNRKMNQNPHEKMVLMKLSDNWMINFWPVSEQLHFVWRLLLCTLSTVAHSSPGHNISHSVHTQWMEGERGREWERVGESSSLHEHSLKCVQEIVKQQVSITALLSGFSFWKPLSFASAGLKPAENKNTGQK